MKRLRPATFTTALLTVTLTLDAQPVPSAQRTQQDVLTEIIARHLELGRMIRLDTPRHNEAQRWAQAGQILCEWAIILNEDRTLAGQVEFACAALREQWPWLVEGCWPCRK